MKSKGREEFGRPEKVRQKCAPPVHASTRLWFWFSCCFERGHVTKWLGAEAGHSRASLVT